MAVARTIILLYCLLCSAATATPYIPTDPDSVLERVDRSAALRNLRDKLTQSPQDIDTAVSLTEAYLRRARRSGDPRFLGYAQAALSTWWQTTDAPVDILLLRALIKQANHDFDSALADLHLVIRRAPGNAQAWLTRAAVQQVRGDYPAVRQACRTLLRLNEPVLAYGCLAGIASLTGQADRAYKLLTHISADTIDMRADLSQWLHGLLAEIALRQDDFDSAARHFSIALATAEPDIYLLASYADALLDAQRPQAVIELLGERAQTDTLLLRLTLAEQRLQHHSASRHIQQLRERFAANQVRGDNRHLREHALFQLKLLNDPRAAVRLAAANWQRQREPLDARLLLEAALAAGDRRAATPVLRWMHENGISDAQLTRLQKRLSVVRT